MSLSTAISPALAAPATSAPEPVGFFDWVGAFQQNNVLLELLCLLGALLLALCAVWLLRRASRSVGVADPSPDQAKGSVWFGLRLIDGVLFPLLWLLFAYAGSVALMRFQPLALFQIALPVLLALVLIRVTVRVLQVAFAQARWLVPIERTVSWGVWLMLVLWVSGLLPMVLHELDQITWTLGGSTVSVRTLIEGALSAALVLIVALWISSAIEARLLHQVQGGESLSLRKAGANAIRALLLFVGLIVALSSAGINLTALGVLGGAIGVGIGFGLQRLAANYVSGFVILTERSMRIGDMIRVDNFEGRITDIKARFTVIRSLAGRESIVPNEILLTNRVENLSLADPKVWQSTVVSVAYGSDVELVSRLLCEAAQTQSRVLSDPGPGAFLSAFGPDRLEFTLGYWIEDPENGPLRLRSSINCAILAAFERHGITIPFPQRVLHLQSAPAPLATAPR